MRILQIGDPGVDSPTNNTFAKLVQLELVLHGPSGVVVYLAWSDFMERPSMEDAPGPSVEPDD